MADGPLPTFLIIGASKCGTTSLASYLAAHPQIGMAKPKELNFFSFNWNEGVNAYKRRFAELQEGILGEASTSYTRAPLIEGVPERMASVVPGAQLVYLIRHPIDRIKSEYRDQLHGGREHAASLTEALATNSRYLAVSRYAYQIDLYLRHFPRGQLLVVTAERLKADRVATVKEILGFLGADPSILPPNLHRELNRAEEKVRIPSGLDPLRKVWRWAKPLTGRIPRYLRHRMRSALGRGITEDAIHLSQEDEAKIWKELTPDLARLREIVGPTMGLWTPAAG